MNKIPIILIIGPTGSGKTTLSVEISKKFSGECINSDSTQIFSGTDIATNKIMAGEMQNIKHHLFSIEPVTGSYSVADYQKKGRQTISDLLKKNKIPVIVGGTGLYINALLKKYQFLEEPLKTENFGFEKLSNLELWNLVNLVDPQEAKKIHVNNRQRLLRANTVISVNNGRKSDLIKDSQGWYFENPVIIIGLNPERSDLHQALNQRVLDLCKRGLFQEIEEALAVNDNNANKQALKCIGGKEIIAYLRNEISYEQAILDMQTANRRYARKQMTWFKNQLSGVKWFEYRLSDYQKTSQEIIDYLEIAIDGLKSEKK
ncbi:tRNA delta(2)-isopentenylpyrophosphate transferase [Spiroplasma sabaudiense Ar-1343]|uniref:tRNA dimethylallyltransferase n=1 Tax=Spiroplasma sabaudiense Ar-1343 TaxID=1276257 RepID=W6AA69_9MOLU|nr:tRNA (adenosine(37)-N6)-dimethylallyltransferase MiaA [Spiroplasma sabaudiense]AHI53962.1 tRNA delta(2)-isopentenylpyrophosphate transferase [Spiroplasma sabaudiense Ar-1343]